MLSMRRIMRGPDAEIHVLDTDGQDPVVHLHGLAGHGAEWQATVD